MNTKAVRLHAKNDLRLDEFALPEIKDDEILVHIISDSICMSSHKAAIQGTEHKRVPKDIDIHPVIIGHEFAGDIVSVGKKWQGKFKAGNKFAIQPAMNRPGRYEAPGYSYMYAGGAATYAILPAEIMEHDCLLDYSGKAYFYGSLAEPVSCIVGAFHASYHVKKGCYDHEMGIKNGGFMAILAGAGPMGLGAIDLAIHGAKKPKLLVVTDIDQARLDRAASILTPADAQSNGVDLRYVNTSGMTDVIAELRKLTDDNGFDDVLVFAAVKPLVEAGDGLLADDGCMNFFAGPTDKKFNALFNFYAVHYIGTHIVGTSGGNTDDMKESLELMQKGLLNPSVMVTHVGGLDAAAQATIDLPKIPGGKKLIYTNISLPMTAISEFKEKGKIDPFFASLAQICSRNNDLWSPEAEAYLLANAKSI